VVPKPRVAAVWVRTRPLSVALTPKVGLDEESALEVCAGPGGDVVAHLPTMFFASAAASPLT
jgi:hypothetical protein